MQVFADFAPSALIPNDAVKTLQRLGEGGFGTVSLGFLNNGVRASCDRANTIVFMLYTSLD